LSLSPHRSILSLAAIGIALCVGLLTASAASAAGPTAIATDSDGVVYSGYASGGTIQRNAGADGAPLASWGTTGNNPGQLGGIVAIDVAPGGSGNVWILDTNRRVQEFTRSGTYIRGFQLDACDAGVSPDPLQRGGLDVTNDMIYVVHPCRDRVYRHDKSDLVEKAWAQVDGPLKGASAQLYGTAPASSQFLFVARPTRNDVVWFDLGSLSWHGPKAVGGAPTDVFVDAYGVLFVSERTGDTVKLYGSDGNLFRTLGGSGSALGRLNDANAFDVFEQFSDLAGNLFIADTNNERIQRWNPFGFTFWGATANGGAAVSAPANTSLPSVSGTPSQGSSVTCQNGSWTNSPTSYTYAWTRNGTSIAGASSQSYTIQAADVGQALRCVVTATNGAGSASATSNPVTPSAGGGVPANTALPQISGTAVVGQQLSCSQGTWTNSPTNYTYRWKRNGGATPIATGQNYTVVAADVGQAITCEVQATNGSGTGTATSAAVTPTAGGGGGGDVGVTINNAAIATNSPGVTLTIREPAGATSVRISNDGGFGSAQTFAIRGDDTYTWTLATSGGERLPKTVYVRFVGTGDANQTFTDDIVLDQRPPLTLAATLDGGILRVKATDKGTGVEKVEYARNKLAKNSVTRAFERKTKVAKPGKARFARTIDGAGNHSAWKKIKRK
jgi:hypothetical protein